MIYTITTNPSLDYYLTFEHRVKPGENNRSDFEIYDAGGKGVNVSIFLNALNIHSVALGFLGGFVKEYYLDHLKRFPNIQPMFTTIKENTRINVKIMSDLETSLNAIGPHVSDAEFDNLKKRATQIYDNDFIVLSGNVQEELKDKMVGLVTELTEDKAKIVLDTDTDIMKKCVDLKPYMIKLNDQNAGVDEDQILAKAKELIEKGIKYVLYSSPLSNSYFLVSKDLTYKSLKSEGYSATTGSGDAMIAGFIFAGMRGALPEERFKYAISFSECLRLTSNNVQIKMIDDYSKNIEVESL